MLPHYYNLDSDYKVGYIDRHNYFEGNGPGMFASMLTRPGSGYFGSGLSSSVLNSILGVSNTTASIGQMFSPYLVTRFAHHYGWDNLFNLLLITSLISAGIMARKWNQSNADSDSNRGNTLLTGAKSEFV